MQRSPAAAADVVPAARGTLLQVAVKRLRGRRATLGATAGGLLALVAAGLDGSRAAVGALGFVGGLRSAASIFLRSVGGLRDKRRELTAMRDESRRKVEELTRLTATLEERTRELAEANARLREADRLRSLFPASVSHELRSPLNSIIGFPEVDGTASRELPGAGLGPAVVRRFVEVHGRSVSRESELGRGGTLPVHLPLDALSAAEVEEDAVAPRRARRG